MELSYEQENTAPVTCVLSLTCAVPLYCIYTLAGCLFFIKHCIRKATNKNSSWVYVCFGLSLRTNKILSVGGWYWYTATRKIHTRTHFAFCYVPNTVKWEKFWRSCLLFLWKFVISIWIPWEVISPVVKELFKCRLYTKCYIIPTNDTSSLRRRCQILLLSTMVIKRWVAIPLKEVAEFSGIMSCPLKAAVV